MAEKDWTVIAVRIRKKSLYNPEQKIAQKISKRHNLTPAVNVYGLIHEYADYEEDTIPGNVDAVTIQKGGRPLIILNKNQTYNRKRFTLAHELGHIVIPWHIGTLSCHAHSYDIVEDDLYCSIEAEANRFASELLIPSEWTKGIVSDHAKDSLNKTLEKISIAADISLAAACISAHKFLEPGYVIVVEGEERSSFLKSPDTLVRFPHDSKRFDPKMLTKFASEYDEIQLQGYAVKWWKFSAAVPEINLSDDNRTSKEILKDIVTALYGTTAQGKAFLQSLNGIIGAVNSMYKPDNIKDFHNLLQQRVAGRAELGRILSHPDFQTFMLKRIQEILNRK